MAKLKGAMDDVEAYFEYTRYNNNKKILQLIIKPIILNFIELLGTMMVEN